MYHFNHVRKYSLVVFNIFTMLCNYHHSAVLGRFHYLKKKPFTLEVSFPMFLSLQPLKITDLFSNFIDLPLMENYACDLLCQSVFT